MSRIKIGRATPMDMANMLSAISTSSSPKIFADCDVVIEAVTENESLKKEVYKALAQVIRHDAIVGQQHIDDLDLTHGRSRAPSRAVHRHALLQSGRSHGISRDHPRRED